MPLLKAEAEKLSNNELVAGVIEEIIDRDPLFYLLPFQGVNGKAYVYDRENTLSEADFLDPNDVVNEGAATFTEVTARLRILAGDVDVDKFLQATMSDTNDQKAVQIAAKAKALARKFRRTLVNGDNTANPKEFDGMWKLVANDRKIAAGAGPTNNLSLSMLDELLDAVPNGADFIMMRPGTLRYYRGLLRAAGGTEPQHIMIKDFGMVMAHNGVPIIVNDFMSNVEALNGSALTGGTYASIYAGRLNEADGLHGLYGGSSAGVVVEDIGTVQNKDATRTRLKWYCGLALKSTKSLARIHGLSNV